MSHLALYTPLKALRQRFRKLYPHHFYRNAQELTDEALSWFSAPKSPFFLYLYYMDTHEPYFRHPYNGEAVAKLRPPSSAAKEAERLQRLYVGEVSYLDEHLGRLFTFLTEQGMMDDCLIVLTSDHGVEFGEHDGWGHSSRLYDEQICVPLIFKLPSNANAGTVSTQLARTLDIAPTILDAAGILSPSQFQGVSLLKGDLPNSTAVSVARRDANLMLSIRTAKWKLITADADSAGQLPEVELYNLIADPQEQFNLAPTRQTVVERLYTLLTGAIQDHGIESQPPAPIMLDEATKAQLRSLGYIQ